MDRTKLMIAFALAGSVGGDAGLLAGYLEDIPELLAIAERIKDEIEELKVGIVTAGLKEGVEITSRRAALALIEARHPELQAQFSWRQENLEGKNA